MVLGGLLAVTGVAVVGVLASWVIARASNLRPAAAIVLAAAIVMGITALALLILFTISRT